MTELRAKKHLSVLLSLALMFMLLAHIPICVLSTELKLRSGEEMEFCIFLQLTKNCIVDLCTDFLFCHPSGVAQGMVMTISLVFLPANLFCPDLDHLD